MPVIEVEGLRKRYGDAVAVDDVSFTVEAGGIVAILGPNGAGKTTTVEILEGFRPRTSGVVRVLGRDPARATAQLRERVGVVLQECEPEPYLKVRELVEMFRGYYRDPRPAAEVLDLVGLADDAGQRVRRLSGGQRRRLDLALALVGRPELVFLDEPTTGFDPMARRAAWESIRALRETGTTLVLTTHYLDEAETLADRILVLKDGRIVADGAPHAIAGRDARSSRIRFVPSDAVAPCDAPVAVELDRGVWWHDTDDPTTAMHRLTGWALSSGFTLDQLAVVQPSLEDVYLELIA